MSVIKRSLSYLVNELLCPPEYKDDEDWRVPIIEKLVHYHIGYLIAYYNEPGIFGLQCPTDAL